MNHVSESDVSNPHSERAVTVDCVLLEISVHLVSLGVAEAVGGVDFGIHSKETGCVWSFNKDLVQPLLALVVEYVGEDSLLEAQLVVGLFADGLVEQLGEPEDAVLVVLVLHLEDERHTIIIID